jgi:hypothetical protein
MGGSTRKRPAGPEQCATGKNKRLSSICVDRRGTTPATIDHEEEDDDKEEGEEDGEEEEDREEDGDDDDDTSTTRTVRHVLRHVRQRHADTDRKVLAKLSDWRTLGTPCHCPRTTQC